MGWLHAYPEQSEIEKKANLKQLSRQEEMYGDTEPNLPDCDAQYLVQYLFDMGPLVNSGGMGGTPLPYSEILAWQQCTGIELSSFEANLIRRASCAYLNELENGKKRNAPSPWAKPLTSSEKSQLDSKIKSIFRE